jgi:hypothetical protein
MSLPAGPMTSLAVALEGICEVRSADGEPRRVPVTEFVTGNHQNVLGPGEVLRAIDLPAAALRKRTAFRRMSLTHLGRSTALLIGTHLTPMTDLPALRHRLHEAPVRLAFPAMPDAPRCGRRSRPPSRTRSITTTSTAHRPTAST